MFVVFVFSVFFAFPGGVRRKGYEPHHTALMEQGELPRFFLPFGVLSKLLERLLSERVPERAEEQLDVAAFSFSSKTVAVDMNKRGKYQTNEENESPEV